MGWYRSVPTVKTMLPDYYATVGGVVPNSVTLDYAFNYNTTINEPIVIGKRVARACSMLDACSNFNAPITILNENMNCAYLVNGASKFNQSITIPNGINDCRYFLAKAYNYNQEIHIPPTVKNAVYFLSHDYNFNNAVIFDDDANRTSAIDLKNFFGNCRNLNRTINFPNLVSSYEGVFDGCTNYNKVCYINNTTAPISFMFNGTALNINLLPYMNAARTSLYALYYGCKSLNIPFNIPANKNNLALLFKDCTNLNSNINIYMDDPSNITSGVNLRYMFANCVNFNATINIPNTLFTNNPSSSSGTRGFDMAHMFEGVKSYSLLRGVGINASWLNNIQRPYSTTPSTIKLANLQYMFANSCLNNEADIENRFLNRVLYNSYGYGKVNVSGLFSGCSDFYCRFNNADWIRYAKDISYTFNGVRRLYIGGVNARLFVNWSTNKAVNYTDYNSCFGISKMHMMSYNPSWTNSLGWGAENLAYAFSNIPELIVGNNNQYVIVNNSGDSVCLPSSAIDCTGIFSNSKFSANWSANAFYNRNFFIGNASLLSSAFENTAFATGYAYNLSWGFNLNVYSFKETAQSFNVVNMFKNITGVYNASVSGGLQCYNAIMNSNYIKKRLFLRENVFDLVIRTMLNNDMSIIGHDIIWDNSGTWNYYNNTYNIFILKW